MRVTGLSTNFTCCVQALLITSVIDSLTQPAVKKK